MSPVSTSLIRRYFRETIYLVSVFSHHIITSIKADKRSIYKVSINETVDVLLTKLQPDDNKKSNMTPRMYGDNRNSRLSNHLHA